jgi:hypothetical protein
MVTMLFLGVLELPARLSFFFLIECAHLIEHLLCQTRFATGIPKMGPNPVLLLGGDRG